MEVPATFLPVSPTLLSVVSTEPDGTQVEYGTLMAAASQVRELVSAEPTQLQRMTLHKVAHALQLEHVALRLVPSRVESLALTLSA